VEISDIKSVFVHWSESGLINSELGHDEEGSISKEVDPVVFDDLVRRASALVGPGYDKTCLTVELHDGEIWGKYGGCKFYLTPSKDSLVKLFGEG
jgi:hypothetical protein